MSTVVACHGPALRCLTLAVVRFCAFVQDIVRLAREFDSRADFLMVYIAEAHAADEWPVGNRTMTARFRLGRTCRLANLRCTTAIRYNQPTVLSQRISIAQDFVNEFGLSDEIQLVVDDLRSGEHDCAQHDNPVDKAYAMWPTRFYVVQSGVVAFKAEPTVRRTTAASLPHDFRF